MKIALLGNLIPEHSSENEWLAAMRALGHTVTTLQEGEVRFVDIPARVIGHDMLFWVSTYGLAVSGGTIDERANMLVRLRDMRVVTVAAHLDLWIGLGREAQVFEEPYFRCDWVFTADGDPAHQARMEEAGINHVFMPPAASHLDAVGGTWRRELASEVAFVGNWAGGYHAESRHRFALVRHLQRRWGRVCKLWPVPGKGAVRGERLRDLYASVKVVVGDSCLAGTGLERYHSDRIPQTLVRGGFLLHSWFPGVETMYEDGTHLKLYQPHDFAELDRHIRHYLSNEEERAQVARQGQTHVLAHHTFKERVREIIERVNGGTQPSSA